MDQGIVRAAAILAHAAVPALAIIDDAFPRAEAALDLLVGKLFVEFGFHDKPRFVLRRWGSGKKDAV
jgi:hypothetical protein